MICSYYCSFGSLICSRKSGIIFNDGMDDFGTPSKECSTCQIPNYIQPGKRPQSSMSPTIMLDKNGKVKMVVGASGGSKIPTGVLQVRNVHVWSALLTLLSPYAGDIRRPKVQQDPL